MGSTIAWCITGIVLTLLVILWCYIVWRELDRRWQTLEQLAAQAALNLEMERKARGPYAKSARHALEVSLSVYREAAREYNRMRRRLLYRVPARLLGFSFQPEELNDPQNK